MIVLDTNVVSELMRAAPDRAVRSWVQRSHDLATTAVTLAEVRYGIARLPAGRRRDVLAEAAEGIFSAFRDQVLPFDAAAATEYDRVVFGRDVAGRPIDGFDAQIAAICRSRGAGLATRNTRDFHGTGVEVLDPWAS
ncbi:MAG: toxin FitB [Pseudonocardiales bacterium]|nr:toxin FitB [Pseudonocardiales bacterium]